MIGEHGTILKIYPLRETSQIIVWLTSRHGIVRTVAKSSRSINSPFHGHLDLFFHNELNWTKAKKGDLHHLDSTSIVNARLGIREDYNKLSLASYMTKLILLTVEPDCSAYPFYDLLQRAFGYLANSPANKKTLIHFERELARLHGIRHEEQPAHIILKKQYSFLPSQRSRLWDALP